MQASKPIKAKVDFDRQVFGVFKAYCTSCHQGGDQAAGGLDLSTVAGIAKGGKSGPLVVAGKPEDSLLIHRVLGMHGLPQMPKGFAPLSEQVVEGLKQWIREGASTRSSGAKHWAYVPPKRPKPPAGIANWGKNPIDQFIGERLKQEGLKPSKEASKEKLLRRVSLDLTGLPPTIQELDEFLADKRPDAYERAVDRLLASPHFGERQARIWLDLARYADTNGYEADRFRSAYLYRDWVIKAFNQNMPFDQFAVEQLAGDLLPNATLDQRIATGFHRNSMFNEEGGIDPEETMYETILDRVGTTATVFMGSTLACARCHDHKFDPFTQADFFRLYAFFANNAYDDVGDFSVGQRRFYEPSLKVPTTEQAAALADLRREREQTLADKQAEMEAAFERWLASGVESQAWARAVPTGASAAQGTTLSVDDRFVVPSGARPDRDVYTVQLSVMRGARALRIDPIPEAANANGGSGRSDSGNFVLTGLRVRDAAGEVALTSAVASFSQSGYDPIDLLPVPGRNEAGAWALFPRVKEPHTLIVSCDRPLEASIELTLEFNSVHRAHQFGRFRVWTSADPASALTDLPANITALKQKPQRTKEETETLRAYFRRAAPDYAPKTARLRAIDRQIAALDATIPTALVMAERPTKGPLKAPMRHRGEFLQKGNLVEAATPAFLGKVVTGNRLTLAKWLFSKDHPLTARVQVNRLWAQVFGRGLVETEEDFGTQGSAPSHPELLDYLACEFRDKGWDIKRMLRLIVTSATYRQDSSATVTLRERDPDNVLLARGPRFRMEAEMIRDNALFASGLLNPKIGGPSVMPYQPPGVWDSPFSGEEWRTVEGPDRYRRALYVYWKRTSPYPSFMAFDATSRETCTTRRIRTNTPLQALALMNDLTYVEAAQALERATAALSGSQRVESMFRRCTARKPDPKELARLLELAETLTERYRTNLEQAAKAAPVDKSPQAAAWTMVATVILNLDETITKD